MSLEINKTYFTFQEDFMGKEYHKKFKDFLLILVQTMVIAGVVIIAVVPLSCRVSTSGIEIIGGDYGPPVLEEVKVISDKKLNMSFNDEINLVDVVVTPYIEEVSNSQIHSSGELVSQAILAAGGHYGIINSDVVISDDKKCLEFDFIEPTVIGKKYEVFGTVKDKIGNSLTFCVPFTGYNSRVPKIIMTEVHTMLCGKNSSDEKNNTRRMEYVEFLCLSDGNLAGLQFSGGYKGDSSVYDFPAVEVKKGEVFVLHLRTIGEGCVSELEDDLTLAETLFTNDNVRDLWHSSIAKTIGDKTDILVLRNIPENKIVDAVMYRDDSVTEWGLKLKKDFSFDEGLKKIYGSTDIENATNVTSISSSKSLHRVDSVEIYGRILEGEEIDFPISSSEKSWTIAGCTPGKL